MTEKSCESEASLVDWCYTGDAVKDSNPKSNNNSRAVAKKDTIRIPFFRRKLRDSCDGEKSPGAFKTSTKESRQQRAFGFGLTNERSKWIVTDSSKSLYGNLMDDDFEDFWIKVDFCGDEFNGIKIELMFLKDKAKDWYLLERDRENLFRLRTDQQRKLISRKSSKISDISDDTVEGDNQNVEETTAGQLGCSKKKLMEKSASMTDLVMHGQQNLETVKDDVSEYNMDGICLQNIVAKSLRQDPVANTDICFSCPSENAFSVQTRSSSITKAKRLNRFIRTKWHALAHTFARCYIWEDSSIDSSSRWFQSPLSRLKGIVLCTSAFTSDDEY